jgi:hypothetical protein
MVECLNTTKAANAATAQKSSAPAHIAKGCQRDFIHPNEAKPMTLSGKTDDDAKQCQELFVNKAIDEPRS